MYTFKEKIWDNIPFSEEILFQLALERKLRIAADEFRYYDGDRISTLLRKKSRLKTTLS